MMEQVRDTNLIYFNSFSSETHKTYSRYTFYEAMHKSYLLSVLYTKLCKLHLSNKFYRQSRKINYIIRNNFI